MAVEILLRVRRGAGDRLDGSACVSGGTEIREFSGMLELLRKLDIRDDDGIHNHYHPRPATANMPDELLTAPGSGSSGPT